MEESQSSATPAFSSSPHCMSNCSAAHPNHGIIVDPSSDISTMQRLSSNLHSLQSEQIFSDLTIYVSGRAVPLHRCILAIRCPFFKTLFFKDKSYLASLVPDKEKAKVDSSKLQIDLARLLESWQDAGSVGYDAFINTMDFLYSGKQGPVDVQCIDDHCLHEACRPAVEFAIEMFTLSSVFDILDLKAIWQNHLRSIVERAQVDEVIPILVAAKAHGPDTLLTRSLQLVASSNMDNVDFEKQLPKALADELLALRSNMGLMQPENLNPTVEKECHRIRKALDCADMELVQLQLKEGNVSLDQAHALHYAVSYCDPHVIGHLLELGLLDVNLRNNCGFLPLHLAAMRRDPSILVKLLSKGANPLEVTPDGRTALMLTSRLIKKAKPTNDSSDHSAVIKNECFCLEILYQAGTRNLFEDTSAIFPPATDQKELLIRLLHLENRVSLARLLFPEEVKLVTGISLLESTSEFVGFKTSDLSDMSTLREANVDLNQFPCDESFYKRVEALQRTVMIGRRMFPRCVAVLNTFDADDTLELRAIEMGSSEERRRKKRRYFELKTVLEEAFQEDITAHVSKRRPR